MKITYLFHSGFLVETANHLLVFDYFKDECKKSKYADCGQIKEQDLDKDKAVIFFVSHGHYDHFDKEIFSLFPGATYILSSDIVFQWEMPNIKVCNAYEKFEIAGVKVETFSSTDEGISFLVEVEEQMIFHAGDLNWWHWIGETPREQEEAKVGFMKEMEKIQGKKIDVAMFPVDPRLEEAYDWGARYFVQHIEPKAFFPMHFQDCFQTTRRFCQNMEECSTKIYAIEKRGEVFYI